MEPQQSLSEHSLPLAGDGAGAALTDLQKAWHVFVVLLSIGRPTMPAELAYRCRIFRTDPFFVEFLCSIPNSPLYLAPNCEVLFSPVVYTTLATFIKYVKVIAVVLGGLKSEGLISSSDENGELRTYYRKKKRTIWTVEGLPLLKKRRTLNSFCAEKQNLVVMALPGETQDLYAKEYFQDDSHRSMNNDTCGPLCSASDNKGLGKIFTTSCISDSSNKTFRYGYDSVQCNDEPMLDNIGSKNEAGEVHTIVSKADFLYDENFLHFPESVEKESMYSNPQLKPLQLAVIGKNQIASAETKAFDITTTEVNSKPVEKEDTYSTPQLKPLQLTGIVENWMANTGLEAYGITPTKVNSMMTSCLLDQQTPDPTAEPVIHSCQRTIENERSMEGTEEPFSCTVRNRKGDSHIPVNSSNREKSVEAHGKVHVAIGGSNLLKSLDGEETKVPMCNHAILAHEPSRDGKHLAKCCPSSKYFHKDALITTQQTVYKPLENGAAISPCLEKNQINRDVKSISAKKKLNYNRETFLDSKREIENFKEKRRDINSHSAKEQIEQKELPNFESFVVEEEEGSGGYGTVYRARRKSDGRKFAVKCPHSNANRQHVLNEVKMLERFGGKNFVIKHEGSFKNGSSDCLVLEHVEHDRPDVLKKEIDVFQLQWYGYCMFRALASLHKQGIVHRDVKPGNFLFTRKLNKGYLIDFNLALDINQKYGIADKSKLEHATGTDETHLSLPKSLPPIKSRKYPNTKFSEAANQEAAAAGIKRTVQPKNTKRKDDLEKICRDIGNRNIIKSQGADGSGITSAKEATSTRNPMAEPLPCHGRKELINFVQEIQGAMQGANHREVKGGPTSKRKRIAAPPGKEDRQFMYVTPMPLHSSGISIRGAGLLQSKGDGKQKREGSCVGTKGFRAPEVLFRSLHQGAKLDVWSAGVSLLYLMIGRSPFAGDPDQNIKEIAKLRGSEDLWEVAKLHDRKPSFPADLFDAKYLPSVKLRDWCIRNTRRPDFFDDIPASLFDLVDKCLTVNPRLRITAEEALRHEFFAPCHESLRRQRLSKQGAIHDSGKTQAPVVVL